ncbi:MAG: hypothetical protein NC037_02175 [Bacteroides sp.]|nr:hypothetical protein [Bacillota bacterium]MCM1393900.1 hypothetical protein [[Eubacterium] siraeum]MCM1455322.1 hypothetical protein [Bacteroides sp.]
MQRQKTIAKWLAIILLLTSIIACYIAFSSIIKSKNSSAPDIAGADADDTLSSGTQQRLPVYSEFPRACEIENGTYINHVGGEDNDVLLDTLYYAGKRFVLFYSASTEYDVKECGLHIAAFENGNLLSVALIGDVNESFVASSLVENGMLIVTKTAAQTKLRLINASLATVCESSCPLYSDYKLYVTGASAKMYTADERFVYVSTVSKSLDVTRSNCVYPIDNGKIVYTAGLSAYDAVFVQTVHGVGFLTYSASDGFDYVGELTNCKLTQVLPSAQNGSLIFTLLAKCTDGMLIANLNGNLKQTASYKFIGAKTAVATLADNSNIRVIADGVKTLFCSHLELQSSSKVAFANENDGDITYQAIDGENELFLISQNDVNYLVRLENDTLVSKLKFTGKNVMVAHDLMDGTAALSLLFDGNYNDKSFGDNDVFILALRVN